jgi:hypothetical protein
MPAISFGSAERTGRGYHEGLEYTLGGMRLAAARSRCAGLTGIVGSALHCAALQYDADGHLPIFR